MSRTLLVTASEDGSRGHAYVMASSSSSSAQAARERLGARLRELRTGAGLSGVEFARRAGWSASAVVSQVEKGRRSITADHVRLWCSLTGASPELTAELLAEQANMAGIWLSLREHGRGLALNARQKLTIGDSMSRVTLVRTYQTKVIPGLLQTPGYMEQVLRGVRRDRRIEPDDIAEALAERLGRQRNLRRHGARFVFLLEETVLRFRQFGPDVHREQLLHLLEVMRLPTVFVAVIPMDTDRRGVRPRESFDISTFPDHEHVQVELLSGLLTLTHPEELAMYRQAWDALMSRAVHGDGVRALIGRALEALDGEAEGGRSS
ncbi:helix-turn-helix transcriptional regulator [Actinocorallia sp. API 0066]|uniref:helix-turn-helix domain-containing protein n=1 Tax=Actinocorallia sp. API 0066 TaxID=2896846 RepID=UPI001E2A5332|nr:helix-turn-helix transcriptional regulator [Actinocorallia sp. API 0066]MCD0447660.1 helix-turn-helix transcriptional regulator [Actinocorallia sp. API 0066]